MIWYADNDIIIEFDKKPKVFMRYVYPEMSKDEIEAVVTYPFINNTSLYVNIHDKRKDVVYSFMIEKGYSWNGADIPLLLWRIIGSKTQPEFLIASFVHDVLCERRELINRDRRLSSLVFRGLLIEAGVSKFKANLMMFFVDIYQRFCQW